MKRSVAATIAAVTLPIFVVAGILVVRGAGFTAVSAGPVPTTESRSAEPVKKLANDPAPDAAAAALSVEATADLAPAAATSDSPALTSVWHPYTRAQLDRLQAAVDEGRQRWRLDPVSVAEAFLRGHLEVDPVMGAYRSLDAFSGEVPYRGKTLPTECGCPRLVDSEFLQGRVLVRRLGGPGSVFFVMGQRSPQISVTSNVAGRTVTLNIKSTIDGEVTAVAGPVRSEATAHDYAQVVAGQQVTLTLKVGARQFPLLVQIIHTRRPGLPARVTEFRLDRAA
jgi:hypothetical protein